MQVDASVFSETKHDVKVRRNNGGSGDVAFNSLIGRENNSSRGESRDGI
jgi:hypothetical protein